MALRVYVGRFNPIHLGHEAVIERMLSNRSDNCLMILGSANEAQSMRHFFSYGDRRDFIEALYPMMPMIGLPDYKTDEEWFIALDDILYAVDGEHHTTVKFFAGSGDDVSFFIDRGCNVNIVDRTYSTRVPDVSATQVRTSLLKGTSLDGLVNPKVQDLIKERFDLRWNEFIKK